MTTALPLFLSDLCRQDLSCADRRQLARQFYNISGTRIIEEILPTLRLELKSSNPNSAIRLPLLYLIGLAGARLKSEVPAALSLLNDAIWSPDKATRLAGLYSIIRIGGVHESVSRLLFLADPQNHEIDVIRLFSLRAVFPIASPAFRGVSVLKQCIVAEREYPAIRRIAVRIISRLGSADPQLIATLCDILKSQIPLNLGIEIMHTMLHVGCSPSLMREVIDGVSLHSRSELYSEYVSTLSTRPHEDLDRCSKRLVKHLLEYADDREFPRETAISVAIDAIGFGTSRLDGRSLADLLGLLNFDPEDESQMLYDDLGSPSAFGRVDELLDVVSQQSDDEYSRVRLQYMAFRICTSWRICCHLLNTLPLLVERNNLRVRDLEQSRELIDYALREDRPGFIVHAMQVRVCAIQAASALVPYHRPMLSLLLECLFGNAHVYVRRAAAGAISKVTETILANIGLSSDWYVSQLTDLLRVESSSKEPSTTVIRQICYSLARFSTEAGMALDILGKLANSPEPSIQLIAKRASDVIRANGVACPRLPSDERLYVDCVRVDVPSLAHGKNVLTGFAFEHNLPPAAFISAKFGTDGEWSEGAMPISLVDDDLVKSLVGLGLSFDDLRAIVGLNSENAPLEKLGLPQNIRSRIMCLLMISERLAQFVALPVSVGSFLRRPQCVFDGKSALDMLLADECDLLIARIARVFDVQD